AALLLPAAFYKCLIYNYLLYTCCPLVAFRLQTRRLNVAVCCPSGAVALRCCCCCIGVEVGLWLGVAALALRVAGNTTQLQQEHNPISTPIMANRCYLVSYR